MEEQHGTIPTQAPEGQRTSRKGWRWVLASVLVLLAAFSAGMAWMSRGLEARVIEAVRPHLATDVAVGLVSLSLWSAWPDVEVILQDVRVEDAIERGQDFVQLEELGFRMGWWPLLEDRLDVRALRLQGGRLRVHRTRSGQENWVFWTVGLGASEGLDSWSIERLMLRDVELEGEWNGEGQPVTWSGMVSSADMALTSLEEGIEWQGEASVQRLVLETGDDRWLDGRTVRCALDGRLEGDDVRMNLTEAALGDGRVEVPLSGQLTSDVEGFSLALTSERYAVSAAEATLPPSVQAALAPVFRGMEGQAALDVAIGRLPESFHWTGPEDGDWNGVWAVRVEPKGLSRTEEAGRIDWTGGRLEAFSVAKGWRAIAPALAVSLAGGEFAGRAEVRESAGRMELSARGRGVFRPVGLWPWLPLPEEAPWTALEVQAGGRIDVDGSVDLTFKEGTLTSWAVGPESQVVVTELVVDQAGSALGLDRLDARMDPGGTGWTGRLEGVTLPGMSGELEAAWMGEKGRLDVTLDRLDVDALRPVVQPWLEGPEGEAGAWDGIWAVELRTGPLTQGDLSLDQMALRGEWQGGALEIESLDAEGMGGRVEATGRVNGRAARFDGVLMDGDLAKVLEGTSGLGQQTLLPRHVRGRVWAQGTVSHVFDRQGTAPWDADVRVRMEQLELIGFELLQEIPEVLESERKYRLIADAQDLRRRLKRVRFEPVDAQVELERGVITLAPVEVRSDAMDVGVEGWYRMEGPMDFTLDFALRDLKSGEGEFGPMEEDGLGHRFFLAIGGTLEDPEFGYDRRAHQEHRREERQGAWDRLRGAITGDPVPPEENASGSRDAGTSTIPTVTEGSERPEPQSDADKKPTSVLDDDDDDW